MNWPGVRTLRSPRFRIVVALALLVIGLTVLALVLLRQAQSADGQFAIDFADYHAAAGRVAAGQSPYAPEMLLGPVPAQGQDRYRYPPPFAQLLVPLSGLPVTTAAVVWLAVQAISVLAAVWLAGSAGGLAETPERLAWSAVAATYFLPVFGTLWMGNVSGVVALAVALVAIGGTVGAVGALAATVLKLVPVTLVPAALIPLSRRQLLKVTIAGAVLLAASIIASPQAWADYLRVLPNLLAGSADYATNLAPAGIAATQGWPPVLITVVRALTLVIAVAAVGASVIWARRFAVSRLPNGLLLATAAATIAMLLLPSALWYHYLCVCLPVAAFSWHSAGRRERFGLFLGAAAVSLGLAWLPLAVAGAALMFVSAIVALNRQPFLTPAFAR
jgi:hypothetical protein